MATTIKDIADAAGVSSAAVSLVLNDRPGIGTDTREKILGIAERMGYSQRKNKAQAGARPRALRFLRIAKHGHIINPNHRVFIADYIDGLEREAKARDFRLEIHTDEGFNPDSILGTFDTDAFDGVVVLGTELDETDMVVFKAAPLPVVFIDTYHPYLGFDFVDMDNESSVHSVVEYLCKAGHRRIGIVKGSIETRNFRAREKAFMDTVERFGLRFDLGDSFSIDSTFEKGQEDMARQLKGRDDLPTALFCVNDIIAYGCAQALKESGRRIPEDVSLVGFDDLPSNIYMEPQLSSVKVSKRNIGRRAIQLMMDRIEDPHRPFEKVLVGGELVVRKSVRSMDRQE
ncbi:MAG: hypothetical protein A2Z99_00360 [Treponema sp. GWB1_62_6]|nr:MAG: hypothetical protein A2001_11130 [Treponema sp. GWC1_61_84]OHE68789.1 MAG: hypothetical protein A2Z99_00360 [Treponema sp. GWB1_62_6]HCM28916.1 LacI family transcriptional regulator [Treponema sp.]